MTLLYLGFIAFVLVMLAVDLFVVNREAHVIRARESIMWTGVTVVLAMVFAGCLYLMYENNWPAGITSHQVDHVMKEHADATAAAEKKKLPPPPPLTAEQIRPDGWGREATMDYLLGWIVEYSLSIDNIFVILVIFRYFRVEPRYQHRVLFWGILGALVMRGLMIWAGTALVKEFEWVLYVFGGFLIFTAVKLLRSGDEHPEPDKNIAVRIAKAMFPVTPTYLGQKFFTRVPAVNRDGTPKLRPDGAARMVLAVTPLFLVLMVIETTDVIFAVDSIPAIIGITQDSFLVFTSNVFALLGLRSLYFALSGAMDAFRYLKASLVFVLAFIGVKMLGHHYIEIPKAVSAAVILGILLVGVLASLLATAAERRRRRSPYEDLANAAEAVYLNVEEAARVTRRNLRRVLILIAGTLLLIAAVPVGLLPGPGGIFVMFFGLMVLAQEFIWAKRLLAELKRHQNGLVEYTDQLARKTPPLILPPAYLVLVLLTRSALHHNKVSEWGIKPVLIWSTAIGLFCLLTYWAWRVIKVHRARWVVVSRCQCGYALGGLAPQDGLVTCPECGHKTPFVALSRRPAGTELEGDAAPIPPAPDSSDETAAGAGQPDHSDQNGQAPRREPSTHEKEEGF